MALSDEVKTRVGATLLIQLTNQNTPGSGSIDDTVLDAAAADAEAEFAIETGVAYDNSIASHVMAGVKGTLYFLHEFIEASPASQDRRKTRWFQLLSKIAGTVGGERRIIPSSDSPLEPSVQVDGSRPDFDRTRWDDIVPNMPPGSDQEDDPRRGR